MSNSPLVSYTKLSPNHSGQRTHVVDRITPHCVVGQCSVETLGNIFAPTSRQASCQYGIGVDGRVGMYVEEKNRSWCSSSNANDQRAITIECASDATHPYAFNDTVYAKLIELCTDICKRYGKTKLLWFGEDNYDKYYRTNRGYTAADGTAPCKTRCPAHIPVQGYIVGLPIRVALVIGCMLEWEILRPKLRLSLGALLAELRSLPIIRHFIECRQEPSAIRRMQMQCFRR